MKTTDFYYLAAHFYVKASSLITAKQTSDKKRQLAFLKMLIILLEAAINHIIHHLKKNPLEGFSYSFPTDLF